MTVIVPGETPPRWELYAGMPCWIELATAEVDRVAEFYGGMFDWTFARSAESGTGEHLIAHRDGYPVASLRESADGESADGESAWRLYLATRDLAGGAERAEELGAQLRVPRGHLPGIGHHAVLTGPADGEVGLLEPEESWQFDVGLPGTLMWAELVTIKAQTADHFYQELFGYEAEQFGMEHRSDYSVWYLGGESVLARVSMIREHITPATVPHWLLYLGVDPEIGVDELVRRAISAGGRVRVDPYDSNIGRVAVLRDPSGARFAVVDSTQAGEFGSAANFDPYDD
ncbi:VOC family protein [Salinifilum aidingensis]